MLVLNLGRESYPVVWELQHRLVRARLAGCLDDIVVLVEHEPVITLGRAADEQHVLASEEQLAAAGIEIYRVERGGGVTYHGPGQLVGYPIVCLRDHHLGIADYMHILEQVLINVLTRLGCSAFRRSGTIGVCTDRGKIGALGARVEHGVTYHGFALNVDPYLEHYQLIIPCGLVGDTVTSIRQILGRPIAMQEVRLAVADEIGQLLSRDTIETTWTEIEPLLNSEAPDATADANCILPPVPSEAQPHRS